MSSNGRLTGAQASALAYVERYASSRQAEARAALREILQMSNISWETYEAAVSKLRSNARVALHFHPDRPATGADSVAEALLEQGIYKSQFETRISNGSVSAYSGGARDVWEKKLFGGAYQSAGVTASERPKYGALDVMQHPDGPAPRFGSCYFLLEPAVSHRCTFTYGGSQDDPAEKGTYVQFDEIAAAVFKDAFFRDYVLGEMHLTPKQLMQQLMSRLERPFPDPSNRLPKRNLNHYIEAQVHGDITLRHDVDALVADPSFRGTPIGHVLEKLCRTYSIKLYWHMGFVMDAEAVPMDFRGPSMPSLARRIARNGLVDASLIGDAVRDLRRNPAQWNDRGSHDEVLQELKYLWHVLVRYGAPLRREAAD